MSVNWVSVATLGEEKMWVCAEEGARVLLADGRTAALRYWPVSKRHELAKVGIADRQHRGNRPRVQLQSGTWLSVKRDDIVGVDFDNREEQWWITEPSSSEQTS
jgi:hypothetical protein